MRNYRKHIDDFFREKLGTYSEAPPPEVWEDLEKRLDGLPTGAPGYSYRWLWHFAIVSVLLLLGVSVADKISENAKNTDIALNTAPASKAGAALPVAASNTVTRNTAAESTSAESAAQAAPATTGTIINNTVPGSENATNPATSPYSKTHSNYNSSQGQSTVNNHKTQAKKTTGQPNDPENNYAANYNGKGAIHGPSADDVNDNDQAPSSPGSTLSNNSKTVSSESKSKKTESAVKTNPVNKTAARTAAKNENKHTNIGFTRFEAGVKGGYEGGFNGAASKLVISPYLQYNLSRKFSLMLQPAIKAAMVSSKNVGPSQSYYSLNEDGKITEDEDIITTHTVGGTTVDTHHTKYTYTQTHSSIVKSNTFGGTYSEVELPILLKYSINKRLSVYGGVNLVYSRLMGVTEHTSTQQGILRSQDTTIVSVNGTTQPSQLPKNIIAYTGAPISSYNGPAYPGVPESQVRAGYMLGFSYACSKKWLLDALMEQTPAATDIKGGYNVNTPLSATYFRLSIGYKLTK